MWPWNLTNDLKQGKSEGFDSCNRPSNLTPKLDSNRPFFSPCDLEILWMTPKNNRTCFLYYIKLCASFQIHPWIQTGVTVWKRPIWNRQLFEPCDHEIWRMNLKNNKAPLLSSDYATWSFLHHLVAICEFKLELQSGNDQSGSKLTIFRAVWPWNLMDDLEKQ